MWQRSDDKANKGVEGKKRARSVTTHGEAGKDPEEINQKAPSVWSLPGQHGDNRDQWGVSQPAGSPQETIHYRLETNTPSVRGEGMEARRRSGGERFDRKKERREENKKMRERKNNKKIFEVWVDYCVGGPDKWNTVTPVSFYTWPSLIYTDSLYIMAVNELHSTYISKYWLMFSGTLMKQYRLKKKTLNSWHL